MKNDIHPAYHEIDVSCSCGNKFKVFSVMDKPLTLDVCNKCHPFITGKQRFIDTAGNLDKFKERFGAFMGGSAKS